MARTILTDAIWKKIQPLLPAEKGYWGRPSKCHQGIIEGILWILRTGAPWRDLPHEYGPWSSCYNRFNRWSADGTWKQIWEALKDDIDNENFSVDGSSVKAHQDACRIKKKEEEDLGVSRGGTTTKIHAVTDGLGRCVNFLLTAGQVHDSTQIELLLEKESCENVLADKAYDSDSIRNFIKGLGAQAVIPGRSSRKEEVNYDRHIYKERHLVENFFQFIKRFRRVGTRYEKYGRNYAGMVTMCCILHWAIF